MRARRRVWLFGFAFCLAAVAAFAVWPRVSWLALSDDAGRILFSAPLGPDNRFSMVFTHSVAKSRVEEVFEAAGTGRFHLRETLYADFGAGLPHEELPGQRMEFADGRIRLTGYDLQFQELQLRVGHIANHRFEIMGVEVVRLSELYRPGGLAKVAVVDRAWGLGQP